ncbi:MAG: O-antigen ligase family protein [Rhodothermales bacterium]
MMTDLPAALRRLEPEQLWKRSHIVLAGVLGLGIAVVLAGAVLSVTAQLIIAALLVGIFAVTVIARNEVALLCTVVLGFVALVRYEEGFQVEEVLYGLVYLSYLGYWYVSRLFVYRDNILKTKTDWALLLFLVYITLSLVLTPLQDGDLTMAASEWISLSMLAFYFPIKEICIRRRDRIPQKPILLSLGAIGMFIAVRNVLDYRRGLSEADYLWQIAMGRVVMNEHVLLMAGLVTLVFLVYARRKLSRISLLFLFVVFSTGVVIGQSRAVWISFALGMAVIFVLVERKQRLQVTTIAILGLASILIAGFLFFDNFFTVVLAGLVDRLFSLGDAATQDLSLVNRFVEMGAAWEHIRQNPVVGYGLGVPYSYYSLVYEANRVSTYVHNAYFGVLYRHGLIGFGLIFFFYVGTIWTAFRTSKKASSGSLDMMIATAAVAFLIAEALAANAANPFATADTTFIIAAISGLAAASHQHVSRSAHPHRPIED